MNSCWNQQECVFLSFFVCNEQARRIGRKIGAQRIKLRKTSQRKWILRRSTKKQNIFTRSAWCDNKFTSCFGGVDDEADLRSFWYIIYIYTILHCWNSWNKWIFLIVRLQIKRVLWKLCDWEKRAIIVCSNYVSCFDKIYNHYRITTY